MRILFLSLARPLPANNGQKMRTWSVLRALAAEDHQITLLSFSQPEEAVLPMDELRGVCRAVQLVKLKGVSLTSGGNYRGRAIAMLSNTPYSAGRFGSSVMRSLITNQLAENTFDVIICDTVYSAVNLPPTSVPVVMNTHNLEHMILQRYAENEKNLFKRAYAFAESRVVRRWEQEMCRNAALAMVCSAPDGQQFAELCPELPIQLVPNVVDVDEYRPEAPCSEPIVLFQGGMDWFPNRDAVSYFVNSILPPLRKEVPGVRFVVAGRNPSEELRRQYASQLDVEFTGTVPNMQEIIARAAVCVVPLRIGSGTRLKILEAAAMEKPIVSTTLGAEGLEFQSGKEIMISDEPEEFASRIAELVNHVELARSLGTAARALVEQQYSFVTLRSAVRRALAVIPQPRPAVLVS